MFSLAFVAAAALLGPSHAAAEPIPAPATLAERQYNTLTYEGCYSSSSGLSYNTSYQFNTKGYCQTQCVPAGYNVQATTNKTDCWCGNSVPPSSSKVDDSYCNDSCAGYGTEMCGSAGAKYLSVYLTGLDDSAVSGASSASATSASSSSTTPSSTTSAKPSVVTVGGQTIVVTASGSPTATVQSSSGGPSKAGIAAGVVVGIVAIAAIAGGIFLFVRNKRRREVEEEYRRNAAVSNFIAGGKPPTSSGGASSFTDTRLDPVMAQRRMSDGSIADNQDYSRRILKVTNA